MREIDPVKRISKEASIFLAASIEYCVWGGGEIIREKMMLRAKKQKE